MSPYRRGDRWYVEFVDENGRRVRRSTRARNESEAKALEAEHMVRVDRAKHGMEVRDRNPNKWTVRDGCEWYLTGPAARLESAERLGYTLRKHITGDFGEMRLERVSRAVITRWLDDKEDEGQAAASVNNLRAYVSGMFRALIDRGHLVGENPVRGTKRRDVEPQVPRALPSHSIRALLDNVATEWRLVVGLAVFAGLRRSEIARLTWANIDLDAGVLYAVKTKKKKPRMVPIHDELAEMLEDGNRRGAVVGKRYWNDSAEVVRGALAQARVVIPDGVEQCFHSLRHTWATRMVECGVPTDLVELMGWGARSNSTFQTRYLHITPSVLRAEIVKLTWPTTAAKPVAQIRHSKGK